jgi:hypothetical protein
MKKPDRFSKTCQVKSDSGVFVPLRGIKTPEPSKQEFDFLGSFWHRNASCYHIITQRADLNKELPWIFVDLTCFGE